MRNAYIAIVIGLISILPIACINQPYSEKSRIEQIDSLLAVCPDSAMYILKGINPAELSGKECLAHYALLLAEAKDKNGVAPTGRSEINTAIQYYDSTKNESMQARAHYCSANIWYRWNNLPLALEEYYNALYFAQETGNVKMIPLVYNKIGAVYYDTGQDSQSDSIYCITEKLALQLKDSTLWVEVLSKQGMLFLRKGVKYYPEAEQKMKQALYALEHLKNNQLQAMVSASLSTLYCYMNDGKKALNFAKHNINSQLDTSQIYRTFLLLGDAYYTNKQYDSAMIYLYKSLLSRDYCTKSGAYMRLADIAREQGDLKTALKLERLYSTLLNSKQQKLENSRIDEAKAGMLAKREAATYQTEIKKYIVSLIILIVLSIIVFLCIKKKHRKDTDSLEQEKFEIEEERTALRKKYAQLQKELQRKEAAIIALQERIMLHQYNEEHKQKLQNELSNLNNERNALLKDAYEYSDVYAKMKRIIQSYKRMDKSDEYLTDSDWIKLAAETDRRWNNLIIRLLTKYPLLSQEDIHLCCLFLTELPSQHLTYLLQCSRSSIYKREDAILENKMQFGHKQTSLKNVLDKLKNEAVTEAAIS